MAEMAYRVSTSADQDTLERYAQVAREHVALALEARKGRNGANEAIFLKKYQLEALRAELLVVASVEHPELKTEGLREAWVAQQLDKQDNTRFLREDLANYERQARDAEAQAEAHDQLYKVELELVRALGGYRNNG